MKRCPKCGTILDDSKKTCYMCGTVLKENNMNYNNSFDKQIGANLTNRQDNVFNNRGEIKNGVNDIAQNSNKNVMYSQKGSAPATFFQNNFSDSKNVRFDDRTALEKVFSNDNRFKNENVNNSNNQKGNYSINWTSKDSQNKAKRPMVNNQTPIVPSQVKNSKTKKNKKEKKVSVKNNPAPKNNLKNKKIKGGNFNLSLSFVFNLVCFILFVSAIIFVYFKLLIPNKYENAKFGGLIYNISKDFNLKSNGKYNRYYTMGDDCAISINYGETANVDTYVDDYFAQIKSEYDNKEGFTTQMQELRIKDNLWYELNVIEFQENPASSTGYSTLTKYRFVSMVYKGTYYDIRYVNIQNDSTCSASYDSFINTLSIEK